jgi:hypothetical protein
VVHTSGMTNSTQTWVTWAPRVLGILVSGFVGLFALDAFRAGRPLVEDLPEFGMHLLPSALLAVVVAVAWRRPWIGAAAFLLLAAAYALTVPGRLDWILVISGPLFLVGMLYLWSARTA